MLIWPCPTKNRLKFAENKNEKKGGARIDWCEGMETVVKTRHLQVGQWVVEWN
jgi:hypothetical protein